MTLAEQIIDFIEHLPIPEGTHVGQPMRLEEFQKRFIFDVYDNPVGTHTAILTMARKNGKTALIAALLLAHLVGPAAVQNSQIVSGAMSREQAALVFRLAEKMILLSPSLGAHISVKPSAKQLIGLDLNVEYRALAAEGTTAQGLSPVLAIMDEVGQIEGAHNDFYSAIATAQGAYENALMLNISTQAATDADLFSVIVDDALTGRDPGIVCHIHAAPEDCDLLDETAWAAANPALGKFRSMKDMRKQAQKAVHMPSFANTFRNLNLNQRVNTEAPFINRAAWMECHAEYDETPFLEGKVWAGLDLSAKADLTAFAMLALYEGQFYTKLETFTPAATLRERAQTDRAPYETWAQQGYLTALPGKVIDYDRVAQRIAHYASRYDIQAIAFDRWRMDVLQKSLTAQGHTNLPFVDWGQGFKDATIAIEALEGIILTDRFRHDNNPVLNMTVNNARIASDPALNRKFEKKKSTGRIDALVALAMAAGIAMREPEPVKPEYQILFL